MNVERTLDSMAGVLADRWTGDLETWGLEAGDWVQGTGYRVPGTSEHREQRKGKGIG